MAKLFSERVLLALVLIGFLAGIPSLVARYQAEASLKNSEVLLDCQSLLDWQSALKAEGKELPDRLIRSGISSLAFGELHLEDLVERGLATPLNYQEFDLALKGGGLVSPKSREFAAASLFNVGKSSSQKPGCYLLFADKEIAEGVARTLKITVDENEVELILDGRVLYVPMAVRQLRLRSLGFEHGAIRQWAEQGFRVWLRPENSPGLSEAQIAELFKVWRELPKVQGVIFGGPLNEAVGYPDALETTQAQLQAEGWKLGYIELPERAQQLGIEFLVRALPSQATRVMAVSPAHQQKLSPYRVLGMYSLGARERNLRVLYVRPYAVPGNPELDEEFLFQLGQEVSPTGPAATFAQGSPAPHAVAVLLMALGAGALALLLLREMGVRQAGWWVAALLMTPVLGAVGALAIGKSVLYRALLGLAIGMGGPTWAFLRWVYPCVVDDPPSVLSAWKEGLRLLALTSLTSLLTGLWIAALLSDTTFLLGLDRFRGVKLLTLGAPLVIIGAFCLKRFDRAQWIDGMMASLRVYQAALAGLVLAGLGLLLLRTGNEAGAAASDSERYLRVFLDKALGVRPRFKEFLLAHPALLVTPLLARRWGFLASLAGVLMAAIGQAGIVDTFAHIHTPLDVTLIRVVLGVVLGVPFGLLAYGAVGRLIGFFTKGFPKVGESAQ